jgi:hypothetical protein
MPGGWYNKEGLRRDRCMNVKKLFVFSVLLFISITGNAETVYSREPTVVKFNNLLSTRFTLGYKLMFFQETTPQESSYQTNRPLDIGGGIGIKNIFINFSFSVPFLYDSNYRKSPSLDFDFNHYYKDKFFTTGFIKYYGGFYNNTVGNIELQIVTLGLSQEFLLNRDHSLRSVYNLDEKQTRSNGSFLLGAGAFLTAIQSDTLDNYNKNQRTIHLGPNFGYSYTWVFKNNLFINVLSTFGVNLLISMNGKNVAAGFQTLPRFSFGYHGKTWSANMYITYSLLMGGMMTDMEYNLLSGNIGLTFIKRFYRK